MILIPKGCAGDVKDGKIKNIKEYLISCSSELNKINQLINTNDSINISHREVSDSHLKELNQAHKKLNSFKTLSDDEIQEM